MSTDTSHSRSHPEEKLQKLYDEYPRMPHVVDDDEEMAHDGRVGCPADERAVNGDAAKILTLWAEVLEAKKLYEMNPPMQEILVQTMYFDHKTSGVDYDPVDWAKKEMTQREKEFSVLAEKLTEVVFRITCRGDLDMLRQLNRPELDVLRYIRQHRSGSKLRVDHEVAFAALDIGRADILKFFHECDFVSFRELYQEDRYECSNAVFGIGFSFLTPEWTYGETKYTRRDVPRWNRRVRDDATPEGVAQCIAFLGSVGAKVGSSRFLRRLLYRATFLSRHVLVRHILSCLPVSAYTASHLPMRYSISLALESSSVEVAAALLESPHCMTSREFWRDNALSSAYSVKDRSLNYDVAEYLLGKQFFSAGAQSNLLMRFIFTREHARTRKQRERDCDVMRKMVQVYGFTYGMHAPELGGCIKWNDNDSRSFVRSSFGVAIRAGEVHRNQSIRRQFDAYAVPRELSDVIFEFENTWSYYSALG